MFTLTVAMLLALFVLTVIAPLLVPPVVVAAWLVLLVVSRTHVMDHLLGITDDDNGRHRTHFNL